MQACIRAARSLAAAIQHLVSRRTMQPTEGSWGGEEVRVVSRDIVLVTATGRELAAGRV